LGAIPMRRITKKQIKTDKLIIIAEYIFEIVEYIKYMYQKEREVFKIIVNYFFFIFLQLFSCPLVINQSSKMEFGPNSIDSMFFFFTAP